MSSAGATSDPAAGGGIGAESTRPTGPERRRGLSSAAMRLVEIRLLEGPNVYRLEPAAKIEVAVGRRRTWYGQRAPARHSLVHLAAQVPARDWPDEIATLVQWLRWLRSDHDEAVGPVFVHRSSDPGHWIVTYP